MAKVYVYYAKLPNEQGTRSLYPKMRMTYIERCKSEKARHEKYWVWVLLEYALKDAFNIDISNLEFTKTPFGKWICDDIQFSLSHTDDALAVALSHSPIGVDIERVKELRSGIEEKILTAGEMAELSLMSEEHREIYLLERWCRKEAIFKSGNAFALLPKEIETREYTTHAEHISIGTEEYVIALTEKPSDVTFVLCEGLSD